MMCCIRLCGSASSPTLVIDCRKAVTGRDRHAGSLSETPRRVVISAVAWRGKTLSPVMGTT
ncbi:hypothetical protein [Dickeya chrysanthemi]|uniref:hypothetical protein n=1 Tax=Dickeya chrysanthemi TaxID=556 RepID=UPI0003AAED35|nr:hypothetical protein [Dickeya chrysanthemi]